MSHSSITTQGFRTAAAEQVIDSTGGEAGTENVEGNMWIAEQGQLGAKELNAVKGLGEARCLKGI
jgi:hypothetical protein